MKSKCVACPWRNPETCKTCQQDREEQMKKVHAEASWSYYSKTECGIPLHPKRRIKVTTDDSRKVTCLKCRKILRLDEKEGL